jgi:hypothetical protein
LRARHNLRRQFGKGGVTAGVSQCASTATGAASENDELLGFLPVWLQVVPVKKILLIVMQVMM